MQTRPQTLSELEAAIRTEMQNVANDYHKNKKMPSGEAFIHCVNQLPNWPASCADRAFLIDDTMNWLVDAYKTKINSSALYWWEIANAAAYASKRKTLLYSLEGELRFVTTTDGLVRSYLKYSSAAFIRLVYSSGSAPVMAIYDQCLPKLRKRIFQGVEIPSHVIESTRQTADILHALTKKNNDEALERAAITVQRAVRAKARRRDERARLQMLCYYSTPEAVEKILQTADTIYLPQCESEELKQRIVQSAKSIKCFQSVSHYTSSKHLVSMLDDGILGRRTLMKEKYEFEKAALGKGDVMNGDVDTVCFGPHFVDPKSTAKGLQITFDAEKLMSGNRSIFAKQKDFLMPLDRIRSVKLKDKTLHFTYTNIDEVLFYRYESWLMDKEHNVCSLFFLLDKVRSYGSGERVTRLPSGEIQGVALCANIDLMTSNYKDLHTIFIMNFFKLLDKLCHETGSSLVDDVRDSIYEAIESLSDEELKQFLTDVGEAMTDSMEFNIPGCHLVDFDSVISFAILKPHKKNSIPQYDPERAYTLTLAHFIVQLNQGDLSSLIEARNRIPNLFNSYRFIQYLIKKVNHPNSLVVLNKLKTLTPTFAWHKQLASAVEKVNEPTPEQVERYRFF